MRNIFEQLTTPEIMAEVIAIIMAALLASGLAHYIKNWLRPLSTRAVLGRWPRRLVVAGMVWVRSVWGRWQSWIVAVPVVGFIGFQVAGLVAQLLPNLL